MSTEEWQAGDWVLDAKGHVWVRADEEDAAQGWAWGYPGERARWAHQGQHFVKVPEGSVTEDDVARPLSLILRDGYPAASRAA